MPEPAVSVREAGAVNAKAATTQQEFLARVESGQATDPLGQYVSKETRVAKDEKISRPSMSDEERTVALKKWGLITYKIPCEDRPDDPDCGGGVPPPPLYTFITSEGVAPYSGIDNPRGDIMDLKIAAVWPGQGNVKTLPGYSLLNVDLNKGAGGNYIYLTFTRDPNNVVYGGETGCGTQGIVTAITTRTIDPILWVGFPSLPLCSWPIWNVGINPQYGFTQYDLNEGAGGDYIYSYQSKGGSTSIEVGVIYGGADNIYPPSPWVRNGVNLNKGAGGFYIYFCHKAR